MAINRLEPTIKFGVQSPSDPSEGYGEIYINASTFSIALSTAWTQITNFTANGFSDAAVTPDHTNDHLTIITPGVYKTAFNVSFSGTVSDNMELEVLTNNGTTALGNIHVERKLGTGGDIGAAGMSGFLSLSSGDTVELWARSTAVGPTITVRHGNLNVSMVAQS